MRSGRRSASRRSIAGPNFEWLFVYCGLAGLLFYFMGSQMGGWGNLYLGLVILTGVAYVLLNRRSWAPEGTPAQPNGSDDRLESLGLYLGLLTGLGLSIRNGLKGWFNIYLGNEDYWGRRLWVYLGPAYLACLAVIALWVLPRPRRSEPDGGRFPHAYGLMWLVLIVQNVIAQLVTGPLSQWNEMAFSLYYLLLFFISAVIVFHYQAMRGRDGVSSPCLEASGGIASPREDGPPARRPAGLTPCPRRTGPSELPSLRIRPLLAGRSDGTSGHHVGWSRLTRADSVATGPTLPAARSARQSRSSMAYWYSSPHPPLNQTFSMVCPSRLIPTRSSRRAAGIPRVRDGDHAMLPQLPEHIVEQAIDRLGRIALALVLDGHGESDLRLSRPIAEGMQTAIPDQRTRLRQFDRHLEPGPRHVGMERHLPFQETSSLILRKGLPVLVSCNPGVGSIAAERREVGFAKPPQDQAW